MSVLYYIQEEYRTELVADFRSFYYTSFYETELDEALDLIPKLLKKPESEFYTKWHNTEAISLEARLLQSVQNAIIASIPSKKGQEWRKKEAMIKLGLPEAHVFVAPTAEEIREKWAAKGWGRLAKVYDEKNQRNSE